MMEGFTRTEIDTSGARIVPTDQAIATDPKKAHVGSTAGKSSQTENRRAPHAGTVSPPPGGMPVHPAGAAAQRDSTKATFTGGMSPSRPTVKADRWAAALLLGFSMFQMLRGRWGDRAQEPGPRS